MLVVLSATHQHESVIILYICIPSLLGLPKGLSGKASTCQCRSHGEFSPWIRKIPWRRKWQPAPVFLPGKFRGQRSWAGYNPRGHKESDKPAWLSTHMVPSLLSLPPSTIPLPCHRAQGRASRVTQQLPASYLFSMRSCVYVSATFSLCLPFRCCPFSIF